MCYSARNMSNPAVKQRAPTRTFTGLRPSRSGDSRWRALHHAPPSGAARPRRVCAQRGDHRAVPSRPRRARRVVDPVRARIASRGRRCRTRFRGLEAIPVAVPARRGGHHAGARLAVRDHLALNRGHRSHKKLSIYAREHVSHVWLINPLSRTFEPYDSRTVIWVVVATASGDDVVRAEPFDAIELELGALWLNPAATLPEGAA